MMLNKPINVMAMVANVTPIEVELISSKAPTMFPERR